MYLGIHTYWLPIHIHIYPKVYIQIAHTQIIFHVNEDLWNPPPPKRFL